MDETKVIVMTKVKETPGTFTYTNNEAGLASRSIYVNKGTWDPMPNQVEVSIKPVRK